MTELEQTRVQWNKMVKASPASKIVIDKYVSLPNLIEEELAREVECGGVEEAKVALDF